MHMRTTTLLLATFLPSTPFHSLLFQSFIGWESLITLHSSREWFLSITSRYPWGKFEFEAILMKISNQNSKFGTNLAQICYLNHILERRGQILIPCAWKRHKNSSLWLIWCNKSSKYPNLWFHNPLKIGDELDQIFLQK